MIPDRHPAEGIEPVNLGVALALGIVGIGFACAALFGAGLSIARICQGAGAWYHYVAAVLALASVVCFMAVQIARR